MRCLRSVALAALIALLPATVLATPYWTEEDYEASLRLPPATGTESADSSPPREDRDTPSYEEMLGLIASFLDIWQVHDPGPDFGGIREGEHLPNIIQTDNTSEAIWVWARYYEVTGDNQYYQNILDAFTYSLSHPAYLEEGDSSPENGYYRMYNCGWAVRAEIKYRDIYGDLTYKDYGDACGNYLQVNTLVRPGSGQTRYINPPVLSWAMGNLYFAGIHESNSAWVDKAVLDTGTKVKIWVEGEPTLLGNQAWAMSGGATMWGLLNAYFLSHPEEVATWVPTYKGYLDLYSDPGQFTNAWNGWYALGHRAVGLALNDQTHLERHIILTDTLITEDGDIDGGVPARPPDTDSQDQTWVSNYVAFMGVSDALGPTSLVQDTRLAPPNWVRFASGPNPTSSSLRLQLQLDRPADLRLSIIDAGGRIVRRIASGPQTRGSHLLLWDGRREDGSRAPSGVYWADLRTSGTKLSRSFILAR